MNTLCDDGETVEKRSMLHKVDLPAGSGKTTRIHDQVNKHRQKHPDDNILVITYTNRAVEELKRRLPDMTNVTAMTIHAFIHEQLKPFFKCERIIDEFFEWRRPVIEAFIGNPKNQNKVDEYKERNRHQPSVEAIRQDTKSIKYAQRSYASPLSPSLSHDDLLTFFVRLAGKQPDKGMTAVGCPMFRKRIGGKYQLIIIDECQDTDPDVLQTFADIAEEHHTPLWVYGDLMQQIFNKQETKLYDVLSRFSTQDEEDDIINHRSRPRIVSMLNRLYNDDTKRQTWDKGKYPEETPEADTESILHVILSETPKNTLERLQTANPNALVLVVFNKERFDNYDIRDLYQRYSRCKRYSYTAEHSVVDVLLPETIDEEVDDIDRYILTLFSIKDQIEDNCYSEARRLFTDNQSLFGQYPYGNPNQDDGLIQHADLIAFINKLKELTEKLDDPNHTVDTILEAAHQANLINPQWHDELTSETNDILTNIKEVSIEQFAKQYQLIKGTERHTSTQHGVKGESHDSIIMLVEDAVNQPYLAMYDCLEIISATDDFNLNYIHDKQQAIKALADSIFDNDKPIAEQEDAKIQDFARQCRDLFTTDTGEVACGKRLREILDGIINKETSRYLTKKQKEKISEYAQNIARIEAAYRILYVCCSRAQNELRLIIDANKIAHYRPQFENRFKELGFEIHNEPTQTEQP